MSVRKLKPITPGQRFRIVNNFEEITKDFSSYSFSDAESVQAMKELFETYDYISEPHGAIGYLGLKKVLNQQPETIGVFLETAHPIKFKDIVESTLNLQLSIPPQIKRVIHQTKISFPIASYEQLKSFLLTKES